MLDAEPFADFDAAARASLAFLRKQIGFDLTMVTRTDDDEWQVLQADDEGYGMAPGDLLPWSDSICKQMVDGRGPRVAPQVADIAAYAATPIARRLTIGAYVGMPLTRADGSLFGTLCAVHPEPKPASLLDEQPVVEMVARLLSTLLDSELARSTERRRAERAEAQALTDALTGLYNRRGWDVLMANEEGRCVRYGHPACVLSIDLDGLKEINDGAGHAAGDRLLKRAADAIRVSLREHDVAARTGGDEFLVLGVECGGADAWTLKQRVAGALDRADVSASVGMARRHPKRGLEAAVRDADALMYARKATRRDRGTDGTPLSLAA